MQKAARERTPERVQLLANVLVGAIENGGHGWFTVDDYHTPEGRLDEWYAVIRPYDDKKTTYRVDLDVIEAGFTVVRNSVVDIVRTERRNSDDKDIEIAGYVHPISGKSLGINDDMHDAIMIADLSDGEDESLDVIGYLAILEISLFGEVMYA